jgi:hypothetical protein
MGVICLADPAMRDVDETIRVGTGTMMSMAEFCGRSEIRFVEARVEGIH